MSLSAGPASRGRYGPHRSRSTNESYCPENAFAEDLNIAVGMSPALRNNLLPRQVEGAIGNILQIGSAPCAARSSSM
ncbi:hypothetical protein BSZ21_05730 [Bradyrhizobium canariense]|nr:hypothetical protein BSZ21_05730 [Bradyrhizobium canariense]